MKRTEGELKIAELARISGVPRSTIHHYENLGLLPPPMVRGPKLHLFGAEHLARLREIRRLREEGLSLRQIKPMLARTAVARPNARKRADPMRMRILAHAAQRFIAQGYEGTKLDDLAAELRIAKATVYRHFESKQALFLSCVEQIRYTLVSPEAREKSERETSLEAHGRQRAEAVLQNFAAYRGLAGLLGSLSHDADPVLATRAKQEMHGMIMNAEPFLRRLKEQRQLRSMDTELLAYMLWGALMSAGDRLSQDDRYSREQVLELYLDFVAHGFSPAE